MRKIAHDRPIHNPRTRRARLCAAACTAVLAAILALAGCGDGGSGGDRAAGSAQADAADRCAVVIDGTAWRTFRDLGLAGAADDPAQAAAFDSLATGAPYRLWRSSQGRKAQLPGQVADAMRAALATNLTRQQRQQAGRLGMLPPSMKWSWEHRDAVDAALATLETPEAGCRILAAARGWIDPQRLPDPLTIVVLPAAPETRLHEGAVIVDTGVLAAGQPDQLARQIAGLLYRGLQAAGGVNPVEASGDEAVAHALRVLRNEGLASWIEDQPHTFFDASHPQLGLVNLVPETYYEATAEVMGLLENAARSLPGEAPDRGAVLARAASRNNLFFRSGYGMVALIDARLGAARTREAAASVPGFLAAYQEAALLNGAERPALGSPGSQPWQSLAPLSPEAFGALMAIATAAFPGPAS